MTTANAHVVAAGDVIATPIGPTPSIRPLPTPSVDVDALRAESRAALRRLVALLRYPPEWADELERQAFVAGRVWSSAAPDDPDAEGRHR